MKTLAFALLALALAFPLRADDTAIASLSNGNVLQNGDFTDGISHWHGDGRSSADSASDNPLGGGDSFTSKGMIIPLKHTAWVKVMQDFKAPGANATLSITYMGSADLAFSTKDEDYAMFPMCLDMMWKSKAIKPNQWTAGTYAAGGEMEKGHLGGLSLFPPPGAPAKPQTVRVTFKDLTPSDPYTVILAFPPGTGTIVILNVSLTGS